MYFPNTIRLYLHTNADDLTESEEFDMKLYDGTKKRWLEPNVPDYDVIALPFDSEFAPNAPLTCFAEDHLFPDEYKFSMGHQVMIIGYPLGYWYDQKHNLPILRSGMISSAYSIPYNGNPYFLVDSRLHKGTSGAPVMTAGRTRAYKISENVTKSKEKWGPTEEEIKLREVRNRRYLLGINARTFPFPEEEESLDLNAVYFSYVLRTIAR